MKRTGKSCLSELRSKETGGHAESHKAGLEFESEVLSDFTGRFEKPRQQILISQKASEMTVRFDHSSVAYDVVCKAVAGVSKLQR